MAAGFLASAVAMVVLTVTTFTIENRYLGDFFAISVVGVALGHRVVLPFFNRQRAAAMVGALVAAGLLCWSIVVTLALTVHVLSD